MWLWGRSDVATLATLAVLVVVVVVAKLGGGPGSKGEQAEGDKLKQERQLNITVCHQQRSEVNGVLPLSW